MRKLLPLVLAGAVGLSLAGNAGAVAMLGTVGANNCTAGMNPTTLGAELYGFKVKADGTGYDDILADLSIKTGSTTRVGGAIVTNPPTWGLPDNFRQAEAADDVVVAIVTFNGGQMAYNSGEVATTSGGNQGVSHVQTVGGGIPAAWAIRNAQDTSLSAQAGNLGVDLRFAPVMEITGTDTFGPANCRVGGFSPLPAGAGGGGILLGYNVYRVPGTMGTTPTAMDFYNASLDGINDPMNNGGWVYLARTAGFNLTTGDPGGHPAPADNNADGDLTGMNNPDATGYTGDDRVIFQDSGSNPDASGRTGGVAAPALGNGYWYAVQPVVKSRTGMTITALNGVTLSSAGSWTVATMNLVAGGGADAADLNGDGNIEFFSPQADAGGEGYGLTNNSIPVLSAPVFINWAALAAANAVSFSGSVDGNDVNLQFTSALESGNVLGFNVYRQHGDARVLVNAQPILASGGEGSVYTLVDELGQTSRRMRHGSTLNYTVDVLYNDGTPISTIGPFTVETSPSSDAQAPARRQR